MEHLLFSVRDLDSLVYLLSKVSEDKEVRGSSCEPLLNITTYFYLFLI